LEEPISRSFLKTRCLASFGILKSGTRVDACLESLITECNFRRERVMGRDYFYKTDRAIVIKYFRVENEPCLRKTKDDFTPFEVLSLTMGALEERVSLYFDELASVICAAFHVARPDETFYAFLRDCITYGEERGFLVRSVSDRISRA